MLKLSKEVVVMKQMIESLSKKGRDIWEAIDKEIEVLAKEEGLSKVEKQDLKKRKLLATKYNDLKEENEYLARSGDELANRAIKRNKLKMIELNEQYQNLYPRVKEIEKKLDNRMEMLAKNKASKSNNK